MTREMELAKVESQPEKEVVDVILCHNGADKDWVRRLAEQIESETFDGRPHGRALRVFFDEWDIDLGQNLLERINIGLRSCRYLAVVISPEFLSGAWPALEWTHVVADDPTNRRGRLIPIFLRDYSESLNIRAELPAPFRALNWLDFRRPPDFKRSFQRLIREVRDQPPARGVRRRPLAMVDTPAAPLVSPGDETSAAPDLVSDLILGNLLPVLAYPGTVWSAPTTASTNADVRAVVSNSSAFVLQEKRLYTFADLTNMTEPLRQAVQSTRVESHAVAHWRQDPVRWRWLISLVNKCLRNHFGGLPITRDLKGRYFFRPIKTDAGLTDRKWKNASDPERTVAAKKVNADSTQTFWVHQGARLSFQTLGDRLFLCIDPCYVFTSDGHAPLTGKGVGPLSIKWGGKERNAAILRHIVFWSRTLGRGGVRIEIATGATPIVLSGIPAIARTDFGIEFDHIGMQSLISQVEDELAVAASLVAD